MYYIQFGTPVICDMYVYSLVKGHFWQQVHVTTSNV